MFTNNRKILKFHLVHVAPFKISDPFSVKLASTHLPLISVNQYYNNQQSSVVVISKQIYCLFLYILPLRG